MRETEISFVTINPEFGKMENYYFDRARCNYVSKVRLECDFSRIFWIERVKQLILHISPTVISINPRNSTSIIYIEFNSNKKKPLSPELGKKSTTSYTLFTTFFSNPPARLWMFCCFQAVQTSFKYNINWEINYFQLWHYIIQHRTLIVSKSRKIHK